MPSHVFQEEHLLQFGLEIAARDPTGKITSVSCKFCAFFGREKKAGAKRARTQHVHYHKPPFKPYNYRSHLVQHAQKWEEYQKLDSDGKQAFFEGKVDIRSTLHTYFAGEDELRFSIEKTIVNEIIGTLLFAPEEEGEGTSLARAMSCFKEDPDDGSLFLVVVKKRNMFHLVLKFVRDGASFRQAAKHVYSVKEQTGLAEYTGCSEWLCATFIRIIVAVNLQALSKLLKESWAFSIGIDLGNKQGTNYLDIRVRFYCADDIHSFHLIAVPVFTRKTAQAIFELIQQVLNVLVPNWRESLLGFTSDGEPRMTGVVGGVGVRLENAAANGEFYRYWCGLHRLDLDMQEEYKRFGFEQDGFVDKMNAIIGYLRRQQNLQTQMGSICPRFVSTRWAGMKKVTSWFVTNKTRLFQWFQEKNPPCRPSPSWWLLMVAMDVVAGQVIKVVNSLQGRTTIVAEQKAKFNKLGDKLAELLSVQRNDDDDNPVDDQHYVESEGYKAKVQDVRDLFQELGMFVQERMDEIEEEAVDDVLRSVGKLICGLVGRIRRLETEVDLGGKNLPPVLPCQLVKMKRSEVTALVRQQLPRLRAAGWTAQTIEAIEVQHAALLETCKEEANFAEVIDSQKPETGFKGAWAVLNRLEVTTLKEFCGGLASVFPTTAPIEADFSDIGVRKDEYKQSMTDFSLEGCLHTKQFEEISKLM